MLAGPTPPEPAARVPLLSRVLIAGVPVLTVVALLGAWVDRQLLNSGDWKRTSAALLRDDDVRIPVADAIAGQITDGSRASGAVQLLAGTLPAELQPAAETASGIAAAATRDAVQQATRRVLSNGTVQDTWVRTTLVAQQAVVLLIEGDNLDDDHGTIYLDLRPVAMQVAQELGFSGTRIASLPADDTRIALMPADRLRTLQAVGNVLDALSWLPAVLALLLAAVAVEVARGARRSALSSVGLTLVGSALLALVLHRLAGRAFVGAVTDGGPMAPTADAVWRIVGELLVDLCVVTIVIGALTTAGAWLVGPSPYAVRARRFVRPAIARRPALVYGGVALAYLAVVAWSPLSAFARVWPVVVLASLLAFGLLIVHRRIVAERPGPPPPGRVTPPLSAGADSPPPSRSDPGTRG